jgi:hypothetical protein
MYLFFKQIRVHFPGQTDRMLLGWGHGTNDQAVPQPYPSLYPRIQAPSLRRPNRRSRLLLSDQRIRLSGERPGRQRQAEAHPASLRLPRRESWHTRLERSKAYSWHLVRVASDHSAAHWHRQAEASRRDHGRSRGVFLRVQRFDRHQGPQHDKEIQEAPRTAIAAVVQRTGHSAH